MSIPKADTIQSQTKKRREEHALKVYNFGRVAQLIKDAATRGDLYVRIANHIEDDEGFSRVANLRHTAAAKSLTRKLTQAGYKATWVKTSIEERSNNRPTGAFIVIDELRITWGTVKIHSGPEESPAQG